MRRLVFVTALRRLAAAASSALLVGACASPPARTPAPARAAALRLPAVAHAEASADAPELLIQRGHPLPVDRASLEHADDASYLQTTDKNGIREWRRPVGEQDWKLYRRLDGMTDWGTMLDRAYDYRVGGGKLEVFDSGHRRRLLLADPVAPDSTPSAEEISIGTRKETVFLTAHPRPGGKRVTRVHRKLPSGELVPWADPAFAEAASVMFMKGNTVLVRPQVGAWRVYSVDESLICRAVPSGGAFGEPERLDWLSDDFVRVTTTVAKEEKSRLVAHGPSGWAEVPAALLGETRTIATVRRLAANLVEVGMKRPLTLAEEETNPPVLLVREALALRRLEDVSPLFPRRIHRAEALLDGEILGAEEEGDANGDGKRASWTWLMRRGSAWSRVSDALGISEGVVEHVATFAEGLGLGVEVSVPKQPSRWVWFARASKSASWKAAAEIISGFPADAVAVHDVRDGLVTVHRMTTAHPSTRDLAKEWLWLWRSSEGEWTDARATAARALSVDAAEIEALDARQNVLLARVRGSRERRIVARDRGGAWRQLTQLLPQVQALEPFAPAVAARVLRVDRILGDRLAVVEGLDDAGGSRSHVFLRNGAEWDLLAGKTADGSRFDATRNVFVRRLDGREREFHVFQEGRWLPVGEAAPKVPAVVTSATMSPDGRLLGVRGGATEAEVAAKGGVWSYFVRRGTGYVPLGAEVPRAFPRIASAATFAGGAGLTLVEDEDADGNGARFEVQHLVEVRGAAGGSKWVSLADAAEGAPAQGEASGSPDGRTLVVRAAKDGGVRHWVGLRASTAEKFQPIESALGVRDLHAIDNVRAFAGGSVVAVHAAERGNEAQWLVFERVGSRWERVLSPATDVVGAPASRMLATRGADGRYEVFTSGAASGGWKKLPLGVPAHDVVFDADATAATAAHRVGIRTTALADVGTEWQWFSVKGDGLERVGTSGTPSWAGVDHVLDDPAHVVVTGATQWLDGQPASLLPAPAMWLSLAAGQLEGVAAFRAPKVLASLLGTPSATVRVVSVGVGPNGTLVAYDLAGKRHAFAVSRGSVRFESRTLLGDGNGATVDFVVHARPDGLERWHRAEEPSRSILAYRHEGARIFFDDQGRYFSESRAASDVMSFRVGREVYSFSQVGAATFRPDLLEQSLGLRGGTLFELTPQDVQRRDTARRLIGDRGALAELRPPRLSVEPPPSRVTSPTVDLVVKTRGDGLVAAPASAHVQGAGAVRALVLEGARCAKDCVVDQRLPVRLLPGVNRIELTVRDANGLEDRRVVAVEYTPPSPPRRRLHALILATGTYTDPGIRALPMTQNDATTARKSLEAQRGGGYDEVHVRSICQSAGCDGRPTKQGMLEGLATLARDMKDGDTGLVFVSGHGVKVGSEYYVVPEDARRSDLSGMLSWTELAARMRSLPLGKKVVLLDTCHAGAALADQRDRRRLVQEAAEQDGLYVLAATAENASAFEIAELGNGVFTNVLETALQGAADGSGDGTVSFEELGLYMGEHVRQVSEHYRLRMEPYAPLLSKELDFSIARASSIGTLSLDVLELNDPAMRATDARTTWWRSALVGGSAVDWVSPDRARFRVIVHEEAGKPRLVLIQDRSGRILGRWALHGRLDKAPLAAMKERLGVAAPAIPVKLKSM